jgi:hypothetical protein
MSVCEKRIGLALQFESEKGDTSFEINVLTLHLKKVREDPCDGSLMVSRCNYLMMKKVRFRAKELEA